MEICEKSDGSSYDSPPSVKNKPGNTCDICEQFVPGNAGSLKVHKWKHQTQSKGQSEGQWCNVCKIFVKGNKGNLVHTETKHKDKAKSDTNSKNKQMPTHLCDLFESDEEEVEFEGYTQDEVDQLEALLNSEMCEEFDAEENIQNIYILQLQLYFTV